MSPVRTFTGSDGVQLVADARPGEAGRPAVLLLHGGGQTRRAWKATAAALGADGWPTIALDLRGHGDSGWAPDGGYALDTFADDVRGVIGALDAPPVVVGASLGGMSALLALAEAPQARAAGLVLVDVAHRFKPGGARRIVDFMASRAAGFRDLDEAASHVDAYLRDRDRPTDVAGLRHNLRERDGRWHWHWDPALLSSFAPSIDLEVGEMRRRRVADAVKALTLPTLLVRGERSDVVTPEIAEEFLALAPSARLAEVPRAGHMVAGDRNDRFSLAVGAFLRELYPVPSPHGSPGR